MVTGAGNTSVTCERIICLSNMQTDEMKSGGTGPTALDKLLIAMERHGSHGTCILCVSQTVGLPATQG